MKLVMRKSGDLLRRFLPQATGYGPVETKRRNTAAATVMVAAVFVYTDGDFAFSLNIIKYQRKKETRE